MIIHRTPGTIPHGLRAFLNAPGSPDLGSIHFRCATKPRGEGVPHVYATLTVQACSSVVALDLNAGPDFAHGAAGRLAKLDTLLAVIREARAIFEAECERAGLLDAPGF